jgi:hypothetical protein
LPSTTRSATVEVFEPASTRAWTISSSIYFIYIYCDGPLLHNGRLSADVISMVTNTEGYPMTRNG